MYVQELRKVACLRITYFEQLIQLIKYVKL